MEDDEFDPFYGRSFWDHPQFTVSDVCKITGATPKALEHFVNPKRNLVRLDGEHANPGTGRRRVFTGGQVLMLAAAYAMTRIGFPQRWVRGLANEVERRATLREGPGGNLETGLMLATYPMNSGDDWNFRYLFNEMENEPNLPVATHLLDVDRLIDQVKEQLQAMIDETEVPDFSVSDPKPEPNPYSPASNFFRNWEKSHTGRWKYVGLTEEETDELMELEGLKFQGDDLIFVSEGRHSTDRYRELFDKHERVRHQRISELGVTN